MLLQTSADGNTTTSVLSFTATKADAGRHLSCQAENRIMGTAPIEDGWILQIQCKLINGDGSSDCVLTLLGPCARDALSLFIQTNPVDFDDLSKIVIRRHAGDADPARHIAESQRHTRRHRRIFRLPHTGRTVGL